MTTRPLLSSLIGVTFLAAIVPAHAANPLPRSTPEAQGISSQAVVDYVEAADKVNTQHSFMIVRHGRVIGEEKVKDAVAKLEAHPAKRAR